MPPLAGKDQFETYCPLCRYPGSRCMIAFDPNRKTLRYECDKCDYEFDVPHRLPKMTLALEDENAGDDNGFYGTYAFYDPDGGGDHD
jgi:hypothetical protein